MKKIYLSPEIEVIEMTQEQALLAGSVFEVVNEDPGIDPSTVDAPTFSEDIFVDFKE